MTSFFLAPGKIQVTQFIPGGNTPANGAQLFLYVAGSVSTKQTGFKDNAGSASFSNPLLLDSGGNIPNGGQIWFAAGQTYKAVLAPSNDTDPPGSPYWTEDNLAGINDVTGSQTEWIAGPQPTFVSGSQFTLVGDQTSTFTKSRRLKFTVTAGQVFGAISSVSFGALTTVNVAFAAGALDAGLTAVSYSLIDPANPSINADYVYKQASSVASVGTGTTNIWGVAGESMHITGTNSIFNFSSAPYAGAIRDVIFDNALILNSSAAITMPGNLNITTSTNDRAWVYANTASSAIVSFYKQNGLPLVNPTVSTGSLFMTSVTVSGVTSQVIFGPSNLDFTLFDEYEIHLHKVLPDAGGQILQGQLSTSGALNFNNGTNEYQAALMNLDMTGATSNAASTAIGNLRFSETGSGLGNALGEGYNGKITFYKPSASSTIKHFAIEGQYFNNANNLTSVRGSASWTQGLAVSTGAAAFNGMRFFMSGANISTGVFTAYALKKTP